MLNLSHFDQKIGDMKVVVIGQFMRLMYYMDDYIIQDKLIKLCIGYVDTL